MASPSKRSYFLELPPELRVMIYNQLFDINAERLKIAKPPRAIGITAEPLTKDCGQLLKKSSILHTSRRIMLEALPIYQQVLELKALMLTVAIMDLDDLVADEESKFAQVFIYDITIARDELRSMVKGMRRRVKAWKKIEKKLSYAVG